jgi:hypothetical protein
MCYPKETDSCCSTRARSKWGGMGMYGNRIQQQWQADQDMTSLTQSDSLQSCTGNAEDRMTITSICLSYASHDCGPRSDLHWEHHGQSRSCRTSLWTLYQQLHTSWSHRRLQSHITIHLRKIAQLDHQGDTWKGCNRRQGKPDAVWVNVTCSQWHVTGSYNVNNNLLQTMAPAEDLIQERPIHTGEQHWATHHHAQLKLGYERGCYLG